MILSNQHGFHSDQPLQNASALPAYVYHATSNRASVDRVRHLRGMRYHYMKQALVTQRTATENRPPSPTDTAHTAPAPAPATSPPPPKSQPVVTNRIAHPPKAAPNSTASQTQQGEQKRTRRTNKKVSWQPGRGAIERIDKYSGKIYHLVETV